ncbi:hypothetical protein TNCT_447571 [Trichonephila clavata]|uniref:TIL domain-containing protein n=1 Tax=Trichonephila clavata TaxID=2740835 RepID=A0A8X6LD05_TRICU|nr:hypothetical protein TNCT_447571 [Trichonephila clavata]
MKVLILCLAVVLLCSSFDAADRNCPANKTYGSFSDCPPSCSNRQNPGRICTLRINYGCKCKDGYVLLQDEVILLSLCES